MRTSRHHADWLSLVEVSGPFVSLPVLLRVFPQGLDARDPAQAKALRTAYDEWQKNPTAPGRQRAWILHVLTNLLAYPADLVAEGQTLPAGLEANVAQMGETLRPDFALIGLKNTETLGQAHLLISTYPFSQSLDRPVAERHWNANPATRMMELLHASGVPLGLVTNGEHWMLVYAPRGETTGYASWYGALWLDEPMTLRAFHSLLGVHRFFGVDAANALLGLLKESAQDQQEVTDQLGYQVREAVQVLVQAFDTLDQDANRTLLKGLAEADLYDAALTLMMRLVFLFSAEERGLLHLGKPLYDDNYAVSTLMEQLQEVADLYGPQVLERRYDAWARLLATFRAVHGGVHHQDLPMPAYGGSLFDPDRYPFLEGRAAGTKWANTPAELLAINNRVVLHLLSSLQRLRMRVPGGGPSESRRISFRALGVEQIGHVYEGLLDHTAMRASEPVLGMRGTRDKETEIPLARLETILAKGRAALVEFLHDETGRSEKAVMRALGEGTLDEEHRLLIACGHDAALLQRVRTFAGLIREDSFERPMVVLLGSIYVTASTTRRSTGTHYTPPSLTEPIVQHTLEPLVYSGPAEGLPEEQWQLKSPKEILDLKVCDMAMGSGAFLVQACRYLSERLAESWENEEKKHPNEILVTPEGGFSLGLPSERLIPLHAAERLAIARRIVADRCLYGVDINPMAVEMAKLSMWLVTLDAKRPFTFLDHAFKCGDSLLGLSSFRQLEEFTLRAEGVKQVAFSTMNLWRHVEEAQKKRQILEAMPSDTPEQVAAKASLYAGAEEAVVKLKAASDVLIATELKGLEGRKYEESLESAADHMMLCWSKGIESLLDYSKRQINGHRPLHWPLAFPEITGRGGFDAFVGNPPFMASRNFQKNLGGDYAQFLIHERSGSGGQADLCAYFFRAAWRLRKCNGTIGLLATNSISEGDTRSAALDHIVSAGGRIYAATKSFPWPGTASLHVSAVHCCGDDVEISPILDGVPAIAIDTTLSSATKIASPFPLCSNTDVAFKGTGLGGNWFIVANDEAQQFLQHAGPSGILKLYLTGQDLVTIPGLEPEKYCVDFPNLAAEVLKARYPDLWTFFEKRFFESIGIGSQDVRWWKHRRSAGQLYRKIAALDLSRVIVKAQTGKVWAFASVPATWLFDQTVIVFAYRMEGAFAVLQSSFHEAWVDRYSSTHETRLRYSPTDVFHNFPHPGNCGDLELFGSKFQIHRRQTMASRHEGLTNLYNQLHDPLETSSEILDLRRLHVELDQAVAAAYEWNDIDLGHGFHETRQGTRYSVSEATRKRVLDRLLALNHQRHAEERAEEALLGAQTKKTADKRSGKAKARRVSIEDTLFSEDGVEA
jgi:hypothetical protein